MKNVLLFGAGTQSAGLLLMALDGYFPVPDLTIFADTHSEPEFVYTYFRQFKKYVKDCYNYDIIIVDGGNLEQDLIDASNNKSRVAGLPYFTESGGMIRRQCTLDYKINPIVKYIKELYNIGRKKKDSIPIIKRWFGMSLDEIERCRVSQDWWAVNYYPLVESRIYRHEVINYTNKKHPEIKNPPRSSCYFCPFHSDNYWRELKRNHGSEFNKAVEIDKVIRFQQNMRDKVFLHRKLKPLKDIDFNKYQYEIFGECEGYCGI